MSKYDAEVPNWEKASIVQLVRTPVQYNPNTKYVEIGEPVLAGAGKDFFEALKNSQRLEIDTEKAYQAPNSLVRDFIYTMATLDRDGHVQWRIESIDQDTRNRAREAYWKSVTPAPAPAPQINRVSPGPPSRPQRPPFMIPVPIPSGGWDPGFGIWRSP